MKSSGRRQVDHLPRLPEALRDPRERRAQLRSGQGRTEKKIVLVRLTVQSVSLAHVIVSNVVQPGDFQSTIHRPNALLPFGIGNDRPIGRVRDDRRAVRAGAMTQQKTRQDIQGDIGAGAADEFTVAHDRKSHGNDGISRVRVDRRLRDHERARILWPPGSPAGFLYPMSMRTSYRPTTCGQVSKKVRCRARFLPAEKSSM